MLINRWEDIYRGFFVCLSQQGEMRPQKKFRAAASSTVAAWLDLLVRAVVDWEQE